MIKPGVLPFDFRHGRYHKGTKIPIIPPTYEFYNPSVAARQLGFGQLLIKLFYADKLKLRETIRDCLEFNRIRGIEEALPSYALTDWKYGAFSSSLFDQWWAEWHAHLFYKAAKFYCPALDSDFDSDNEVRNSSNSRSAIISHLR
jgi:hypothetical protein